VAFALGRALGPAVTRNQLRRRLRAICRELTTTGDLPPGMLLIGASPAVVELTYAQLDAEMRSMVRTLRVSPTTSTAATTTLSPAITMPLTRADAPSA
jgi:ribonuclease P protein component